jgi:hypothetical protein
MASPRDIMMLRDFGFKDHASLKNALKTNPRARSRSYDFTWRLKMVPKYEYYYSAVKIDITKYYEEYEDFKLRGGTSTGYQTMPSESLKKAEYLFGSWRGNPWKQITLGKGLYSIKDPRGSLWFSAIDSRELVQAIDICCYPVNKNKFPPTKPVPKMNKPGTYKLNLDYNKCKASYNQYKNKGSLWMKRDWFIALMICKNITTTWDTRTGDWKPWNNKWCRMAHEKPGFTINKFKLRDGKVQYIDIARFVMTKGLGGMAKGAYILGVAFAVGGDTAGKIITGFCRDNHIPLSGIRM